MKFNHIPPHNLNAELAVLSALLKDNGAITQVMTSVSKNDFYFEAHQILFALILELFEKSRSVDLLIIHEEVEKRGLLEKIGGMECLLRLDDIVPSAAHIEEYCSIVKNKSMLRSLILTTDEIQKLCFESTSEDVSELLDQSEKLIFDVTQRRENSETVKLGEVLKSTFKYLESLGDQKGRLTGLSTGFHELDDMTCGLQNSDLLILAARPSMGKTSFALNIIEYIGCEIRTPVAFFSLEMSRAQVAQNMLCARARINAHRLRRGELATEEWQQLSLGVGMLSEAPIFIDDTPGLSIMQLRGKARRLKAQYNIGLIVIDYLQLMEGSGSSAGKDNRQAEISYISRSLKGIARELSVPVISLSQLNRSVDQREGHKPRLSDLRESGAIEQDADVILFMFRPEYYNTKDESLRGKAELTVAKQRNGPTGEINLVFLKEYMRFENYAHDMD
jgi:replicative DNA helicase